MLYFMDMEIEEGYVIDIKDKDGKPLKDKMGRPIQDENGKRVKENGKYLKPKDFDYEFYGDVGSTTDETGEFRFKLNGDQGFAKEAEKGIISMKIKKDWQISVTKDGQPVNPKFTLWQREEDDDICITLLSIPVCF